MTDSNNKLVQDSERRKPPAAGKGRPKGAVNKITRTIREAIETAFHTVGGSDYLAEMAREQPVAFMTLFGKVLPAQINHEATIKTSPDSMDLSHLTDEQLEVLASIRIDGEAF